MTTPPERQDQERAISQLIDERDRAEEFADALAAAIARESGVDIGEHSNMNDPWTNALDAAQGLATRVRARRDELAAKLDAVCDILTATQAERDEVRAEVARVRAQVAEEIAEKLDQAEDAALRDPELNHDGYVGGALAVGHHRSAKIAREHARSAAGTDQPQDRTEEKP